MSCTPSAFRLACQEGSVGGLDAHSRSVRVRLGLAEWRGPQPHRQGRTGWRRIVCDTHAHEPHNDWQGVVPAELKQQALAPARASPQPSALSPILTLPPTPTHRARTHAHARA